MHVDLMRKVDFWVGVPLCLALSLGRALFRIVGRTPVEPRAPRRILLIQLAETGGLVVACPAVSRLRQQFPDAQLYYLTFPLGGELLDLLGVPLAQRIIIRPDGLIPFVRDVVRALRTLRALRIDTVLNLETFARFSTIMAFLSGATRRVGFFRFYDEGRYTGRLLTHPVVYTPHQHAARSYLSLVEALAACPDRLPESPEPLVKKAVGGLSLELPRAFVSQQDKERIRGKLAGLFPALSAKQKIVLLNPNASDLVGVRRWPRASFLELARELLEDPDILVVITGARGESAAARSLAGTLDNARAASLAGCTSLKELLALYSVSSLLVSNDSGPAHFASLTGLPVLVLFGPETPRVYGPLGSKVEPVYLGLGCSPCISAYNQKRSPCTDNRCLQSITPDYVFSRAQALLQGEAPKRLLY